jgi:hypothetical protein
MNPAELLASARQLLDVHSATTDGMWPWACAFLARQALEAAIDEVWAAHPSAMGLAGSTIRSQLICLPRYLDPGTAREMAYVYAALSEACHYHAYELAPTATELTRWIAAVGRLLTATAG